MTENIDVPAIKANKPVNTKAQWKGSVRHPKIVHLAKQVNGTGEISALCFKRPHPIDPRYGTWTMRNEGVTCWRCLKISHPRASDGLPMLVGPRPDLQLRVLHALQSAGCILSEAELIEAAYCADDEPAHPGNGVRQAISSLRKKGVDIKAVRYRGYYVAGADITRQKYLVKAEGTNGATQILGSFASRVEAEDHPVKLKMWRRVWIERSADTAERKGDRNG